MLPCPKCSSEDAVEVVGQGPQQVEILAMDEKGNPTQVHRHPRDMYECTVCNVTLIEDRIAGVLTTFADEKGKPIPTRRDVSEKNADEIAKDRKRIYDPRANAHRQRAVRRG